MMDLKIAIISDELTQESLELECRLYKLTPLNYRFVLQFCKPDILLVESCWNGYRGSWKYKVASYPDVPKRTNKTLLKVIDFAKQKGIPTVFWNKEDDIHFDRFINSAKHFDYILTVDQNCVAKYQDIVGEHAKIKPFMFAVQPAFHNFTGFNFKYQRANFVGSYSKHVHPIRKIWQDMMFEVAQQSTGLTLIDRNSERKSNNYRYPSSSNIEIKPAIPYFKTADIYKDYMFSLNVNTIVNSPTMFSRRLIEIIACGGIVVTNPSLAVQIHFAEFCNIVETTEQAQELFGKWAKDGPSKQDLEKAEAGAIFIVQNWTWEHRLKELMDFVNNK